MRNEDEDSGRGLRRRLMAILLLLLLMNVGGPNGGWYAKMK
jgi:hypothetical protein